jgi:hypothetical protein
MRGGADSVGVTRGVFVTELATEVWLGSGFVAMTACTVKAAAVIISDSDGGVFPGRLQERIVPPKIKMASRLFFICLLQGCL